MVKSVVEYICDQDHYFSDEFANATYECDLGAFWVPKTRIACIKGILTFKKLEKFLALTNFYFIEFFINFRPRSNIKNIRKI